MRGFPKASVRQFLLVLALAAFVLGCGTGVESADVLVEPTTEPTAVPTATAAPTATATPTATAASPTATAEPTISPTAAPSATPEPTATAEPAVAPSAAPTVTVTPVPTTTPEPVDVPSPTPEATPTVTPDLYEPKPDLEPTDYDGEVRAIRTATGLVLPVRDIAGLGYQVVTPCYNLATVQGGLELSGPLDVLIDPGHGGDESGAVGPNGLKESTVNLQVAELLREQLQARGFTVELTRYSDHRVAIQSRATLANSLAPRIFMSIHHNGGYPDPFPVAGTEVFVQLDDPESARLGGLVFQEVQVAFADVEADWMGSLESFGVAWRQNDEGTDLYGVLRRTPDLVSVLTEAMFISTEAEADLLALPETLETEATALANAVERFFETDDPGTGFIEGIVFEGDLGNGGGTEGCVDPPLS